MPRTARQTRKEKENSSPVNCHSFVKKKICRKLLIMRQWWVERLSCQCSCWPSQLSPSQEEAVTWYTLATEPFQPLLKVLAELERDDPKFAFPAARLIGLYRRLWESCVSKHIGQKPIDHSVERKNWLSSVLDSLLPDILILYRVTYTCKGVRTALKIIPGFYTHNARWR